MVRARMVRRRTLATALDPIRSSAAIRAWYAARLERELDAYGASMLYWLRAQWRKAPPELAMDASPARELQRILRKRGRLWRAKFAKVADLLAAEFANKSQRHVDRALGAMLKDRGLTVRFRLSRSLNDALQATVGEQVSLISSLASEHQTRVEGYVMRAVQTGQDLKQLTDNLEEGLGIARRRAAFIARHQTSVATATISRTRNLELGCTEGFWLHSAGGKKPRPEHVAFSGKRYSLTQGAFLEGKWTHPGVEPNCRCVSRPILPSFAEL